VRDLVVQHLLGEAARELRQDWERASKFRSEVKMPLSGPPHPTPHRQAYQEQEKLSFGKKAIGRLCLL